jgi:signal transduction histidine kinase
VTAREEASIDALAREQELERRVGERTRELAATCRELEAFTSAVSHDVRTPLAGIRAFAEVLSRKNAHQLTVEGREYLARIVAASEAMQDMIRGLLDLSRHALAPMNRRPLDVSRIAREAYALHLHALGERPAEFVVQDGLQATGDPALVATLLQNLIGNALKYSRHRDPAVIEVGAVLDGGAAQFFVRDNGAGFDPFLADRLFRPFSRLHSEAAFEGHGIGLATCSRIVARHGGAIWAEGAVGQGATFHFSLSAQ